jgi:hypothetical protein
VRRHLHARIGRSAAHCSSEGLKTAGRTKLAVPLRQRAHGKYIAATTPRVYAGEG